MEFTSLTSFILEYIRERPGTYLRELTIANLELFILGFQVGYQTGKNASEEQDPFFDDISGFRQWYLETKQISNVNFSTWDTPFLQEAKGDEAQALFLYFDYLDKYQQEKKSKSY